MDLKTKEDLSSKPYPLSPNRYNYHEKSQLKKAREMKAAGLYPFFRAIEDSEARRVQVNGKKMVMIGSNNYLGLTHHPYVIEKAKAAIDRFGTGCTGSRFLNGNLSLHEELEERLARFLGKERALVFATGMQVNLGTISAIGGQKDCLISDLENHASLLDGLRLSHADQFKYKHNNMQNLEQILQDKQGQYQNIWIVADGVFSMTGDIVKMDEMVELAKRYGAHIYIDDAHGMGVLGPRGEGTVAHFGKTDDVDLIMGTFSKSFASIGGLIAGDAEIIDYIQHYARSFIFSAAMAPSAVATVLACLDILESDNDIHANLWRNVRQMREGLKELGFYTYNSQTPVIPILIGEDLAAFKVTHFLAEHGVFATPVISPAVPKGEALIRTSYMATHTSEDLEFVLSVFKKVKDEFGIVHPGHKTPLAQ